MKHFQLSEIDFSLPESYGELTFRQFLKLRDSESETIIHTLNLITGISDNIWESIPFDEVDKHVLPCLNFLSEKFPEQFIKPDRIKIDGVWYDIPKDIASCSFGQKIALEKASRKAEETGLKDIDLYPFVVALYMQPVVSGKPYNYDEVEALEEKIKDCQVGQIFPVAAFFLTNSLLSSRKKKKGFPTLLPLRKKERGLISLRSSESYRPYGPFRRVLIKLLKKFSLSRIHLST